MVYWFIVYVYWFICTIKQDILQITILYHVGSPVDEPPWVTMIMGYYDNVSVDEPPWVTMIMCQVMKNDKSWRGMLLKDNEGDWGVAVAAWRGMKKGQPGIPGNNLNLSDSDSDANRSIGSTTGCTITEMAPTRAFSWLKAPIALSHLRHY